MLFVEKQLIATAKLTYKERQLIKTSTFKKHFQKKTTLIRWFSISYINLQRNIPMFSIRSNAYFILQHTKRFYQFTSGVLR
jgi:hypothetical protein